MKDSTAVDQLSIPLLRDRIRYARDGIGFSRAELARRVGVVPSAAVQWEREKGTSPSIKRLSAIARVTEVSFDWLATGRGFSRYGAAHEDLVIHPDDFARDPLEGAVLGLVRRMPQAHRFAFLDYLKTLYSGKRLLPRKTVPL